MTKSVYSKTTREFESHEQDPEMFKHNDHLRAAFEMLRAYDFIEASARYASNIRALAEKAGVPQKFNVTITYAFMSLIAERMLSGEFDDYEDFLAGNMDLKSKNLLDKWYSPERLNSDFAREVFLMPDVEAGEVAAAQ